MDNGSISMSVVDIRVSIITCIYNRADRIKRTLDSVKSQTVRGFVHVLIDDGSTDNIDEVVNIYIDEVDYPVIFVRKENGGKHTATNLAWSKYAQGEFVINLDSDDTLEPDAIEHFLNCWDLIQDKNKYWQVVARCKTQRDNNLLGELYPEDINLLDDVKAKRIAKRVGGEKIAMHRLEVLKQFYFPECDGVTFVKESTLWGKIGWRYKSYYSNKIVRTYYVGEGEQLSRPRRNQQHIINTMFSSGHILINIEQYRMNMCEVFSTVIRFSICKRINGDDYFEYMPKMKRWIKFIYYVCQPIAFLGAYYYKRNKMCK